MVLVNYNSPDMSVFSWIYILNIYIIYMHVYMYVIFFFFLQKISGNIFVENRRYFKIYIFLYVYLEINFFFFLLYMYCTMQQHAL